MTSTSFFLGVIAVFVAAVLWAAIVQIRSALMVAGRLRNREAIDHATRSLLDALVDKPESGPGLGALAPRTQAAVLARLAASIEGSELEHLRGIAADSGAVARARMHVTDRRWWERLLAVSLLSALSMTDANQLRLLEDPHPVVRAAVVRWVQRTGLTVAAASLVLDLLADSDGLVQAAARDALATGGSAATPVLVEALEASSHRRLVLAVLEIAAVNHDVELVNAARPWATNEDPDLRAAAAGVFATGNDSSTLRALLNDPQPTVRVAAMRAAGRGRHKSLTGDVGRGLRDDNWRVRDAAVGALNHLGAPGKIVLRYQAENDREKTSL